VTPPRRKKAGASAGPITVERLTAQVLVDICPESTSGDHGRPTSWAFNDLLQRCGSPQRDKSVVADRRHTIPNGKLPLVIVGWITD